MKSSGSSLCVFALRGCEPSAVSGDRRHGAYAHGEMLWTKGSWFALELAEPTTFQPCVHSGVGLLVMTHCPLIPHPQKLVDMQSVSGMALRTVTMASCVTFPSELERTDTSSVILSFLW